MNNLISATSQDFLNIVNEIPHIGFKQHAVTLLEHAKAGRLREPRDGRDIGDAHAAAALARDHAKHRHGALDALRAGARLGRDDRLRGRFVGVLQLFSGGDRKSVV